MAKAWMDWPRALITLSLVTPNGSPIGSLMVATSKVKPYASRARTKRPANKPICFVTLDTCAVVPGVSHSTKAFKDFLNAGITGRSGKFHTMVLSNRSDALDNTASIVKQMFPLRKTWIRSSFIGQTMFIEG